MAATTAREAERHVEVVLSRVKDETR